MFLILLLASRLFALEYTVDYLEAPQVFTATKSFTQQVSVPSIRFSGDGTVLISTAGLGGGGGSSFSVTEFIQTFPTTTWTAPEGVTEVYATLVRSEEHTSELQ